MKPGDQFDCPHCGKDSFLKKETLMEGWTRAGEVLKCASCGAVIQRLDEAAPSASPKDRGSGRAGLDALSALLGGDTGTGPAAPEGFLDQERKFCRDCAYRIATAFRMRCGRHDRDVNPMDDCPDFTPRSGE